ncbi:hypothetical protein ABZ319_10385 [Nocardia sp. NPDC005978]|uniref:hypothetical protein n=1 Tax=Nocardia sp. NPDC005978 TaxID=3156725 RepID=UPI0033AC5D2F
MLPVLVVLLGTTVVLPDQAEQMAWLPGRVVTPAQVRARRPGEAVVQSERTAGHSGRPVALTRKWAGRLGVTEAAHVRGTA